MPMSQEQLVEILRTIRAQARQSLRKMDKEFEAVQDFYEMFRFYRTHRCNSRDAPLFLSRTPAKIAGPSKATREVLETSSNQVVTSSTYDQVVPSENLSRRTLRPRKIKVDAEDSVLEASPPVLFMDSFKVPKAPSKNLAKSCTLSSKGSKKFSTPGSNPDQTLPMRSASKKSSALKRPSSSEAEDAAPELIEADSNSSSSSGIQPSTRSSKRLNKCIIPCSTPVHSPSKSSVKRSRAKGDSISDGFQTLAPDMSQSCKKSIGANATYDIIVLTTNKQSIGLNGTYNVEEASSEESTGANTTYTIDPLLAKEINSTYVVDTSNSKEESAPGGQSSILAIDGFSVSLKENLPQTIRNPSAEKTSKATSDSAKNEPLKKAANRDCSSVKAARKSLSRAKETLVKKVQPATVKIPASSRTVKISTHSRTVKIPTPSRTVKIPTPMRGTPSVLPLTRTLVSSTDFLSKLASKALSASQKIHGSKMEDRKLKKGGPEKVQGTTPSHETNNEAVYKAEILNAGHKFLSKGSMVCVQKEAFPNAIKCQSAVSSKFEFSSYDITLNPEDRNPIPSKSSEDYGLDDADADDSSEDESNPKKVVPPWAQASARVPSLRLQHNISLQQMFTFFDSGKSTPDLTKIFKKIDSRLLLRRSSAIWESPKK